MSHHVKSKKSVEAPVVVAETQEMAKESAGGPLRGVARPSLAADLLEHSAKTGRSPASHSALQGLVLAFSRALPSLVGPASAPHLPACELTLSEGEMQQIERRTEALECADAQPEMPYDGMLYVRDAHHYDWREIPQLSLFGPDAKPSYRQIRLNLSPDGAVGAALASVQATSPLPPSHSIDNLEAGQESRIVQLFRRLGEAGHGAPIDVVVDDKVPATRDLKVLGDNDAAWPFIVYKALAKVWTYLEPFHADGAMARLRSWVGIVETLTGKSARLESIARLSDDALRARLADVAHGAPAALAFGETPALPRTLGEFSLQPVLGGLGVRVMGPTLDVVLLWQHVYSILRFDALGSTPGVLLYNPLGRNPDPKSVVARRRGRPKSSFCLPEEISELEQVDGELWVPLALVRALGLDLYSGSL